MAETNAVRIYDMLRDHTGRRYGQTSIGAMPAHIAKGCTRAGLDMRRPAFWDSHAATWIVLTDDASEILIEINPRAVDRDDVDLLADAVCRRLAAPATRTKEGP